MPGAPIKENLLEKEVVDSVVTISLEVEEGIILPATTKPPLFEVVVCCSSDDEAADGDRIVLEGVDAIVEIGCGGSVFADLISLADNVAAPGPLPPAGTEPTCFDDTTFGASLLAADGEDCADDGREVGEDTGVAVASGLGGSVLAD